MNKAERAIKALREAADALEDIPFRWSGFLGPVNSVDNLRGEATFIEEHVEAIKHSLEEVEIHEPRTVLQITNNPGMSLICVLCRATESPTWWKCCPVHTPERSKAVVCESCYVKTHPNQTQVNQ